MKQYIADAFAEELFTGNPAAVVPCRAMPSPEIMQKIAIENAYSETAFVVKTGRGTYDLKWFTPGGEIDLCGHATLAAAFVLHTFEDPCVEEMHFRTLSGELTVTKGERGFTMSFPTGKIKPIPLTDAIMRASGGLAREAYYDGGDMVIIVEDEEKLRQYVPQADLILKTDGLGMILTAPSSQYNFVSRCFYPKLNILEDPVTGRAHTYSGPLWSERLKKEVLVAKQISPHGGVVTVRPAGDRVYLSGNVQLFMQGELPFDL